MPIKPGKGRKVCESYIPFHNEAISHCTNPFVIFYRVMRLETWFWWPYRLQGTCGRLVPFFEGKKHKTREKGSSILKEFLFWSPWRGLSRSRCGLDNLMTMIWQTNSRRSKIASLLPRAKSQSPEPCAKGFESALNWFKDNNTSHVDNHPLKTEKREVNDVLNILKDFCNPPSRTYGCLILTRPLPRYLRTAVMFLIGMGTVSTSCWLVD